MKAITVIESDDGQVVVTGNALKIGDTYDAVNLLHLGIEAIASPLRLAPRRLIDADQDR